MANFYAFYPPSGGGSANASVGSNGAVAPTSSTEVGFIDGSGNLQGVSPSQPLPVTVVSGPNPTNVNIADIAGTPPTVGAGASSAGTQRVILSSDSPLPTGAATSALQTTGNSTLTTINTTLGSPFQAGGSIGNSAFGISGSLPAGSNAIGSVSVSNFPSTTPPAAPFSGQQTSTGTAVAIASSQALVNGVIVQAKSSNVGSVYVGPSGITSSTGFELQPGQATSVAVNNLNAVFVISVSSGDGICYIGS